MIPKKKKTSEEIAALREGLGIPDAIPNPGDPRSRPEAPIPAPIEIRVAPPSPATRQPAPSDSPTTHTPPAPQRQPLVLDPDHPDAPTKAPLESASREAPIHLEPGEQINRPTHPASHTLRKKELPLAPAPAVTHRTALPSQRHDPKDIAELHRRDALTQLTGQVPDPAAHLRGITARPLLYITGYLLAIAAAILAWQRAHHLTPLILLLLATAIVIYIFFKKPRSRHHAAFIFIIIFMTIAFGGIHYAPLFLNAP